MQFKSPDVQQGRATERHGPQKDTVLRTRSGGCWLGAWVLTPAVQGWVPRVSPCPLLSLPDEQVTAKEDPWCVRCGGPFGPAHSCNSHPPALLMDGPEIQAHRRWRLGSLSQHRDGWTGSHGAASPNSRDPWASGIPGEAAPPAGWSPLLALPLPGTRGRSLTAGSTLCLWSCWARYSACTG